MAVLKVIELMASSDKSFEDAVQNGVKKASETIKHIRSAYVKDHSATVKDGKVHEYRVDLKISFVVD